MKIAFAGGGTGGHLAPAIAVLEELRFRGDDSPALFLTAGKTAENLGKMLPAVRSVLLPAAPLAGRRWWTIPRALMRNRRGYRLSRAELTAASPDLVVGLGGYVSAPPVLAARRLGIPVVLHEQNLVMGRANRFLARYADRVVGSYPLRLSGGAPRVLSGIGFPIRQAARLAAPEGTGAGWGLEPGRFTVLVLGGSRGARPLNRLLEEALRGRAIPGDAQFIHCTGPDDRERMAGAYRAAGLPAAVFASLAEIGQAYSLARLVIGRAGGATLGEIAYWGLPAILVPYPLAADDHQLANARYFQEAGAALVYEQADLTAPILNAEIRRLRKEGELLKKMSAAARGLYLPGAAGRMVDIFREVLENKHEGLG
ncbi:MAG: UDP-N-acetylglucosamine--N-acetylmuramyl-(pentapeptide) pyrophosphoryl-undecaprenol N-acetylglucosamine transferase [PVC group bacterium]